MGENPNGRRICGMNQVDNTIEVPEEKHEDTAADLVQSTVDEIVEEKPREELIDDPDDPLKNMEAIESMMQSLQSMIQLMESNWKTSSAELGITEEDMKKLTVYNNNHKTPMPEDLTKEEKDNWDHWNGLDQMTEEDLEEIFGKEHKVYGLSHEATIDRVKSACNDFLSWISMVREYQNIHDAYLQLVELEEEKQINELRAVMEEETDESKKAVMQKSIDDYYKNKFLGFLADPLPDDKRDRLLKVVTDQNKLNYWIKRSRDKLKQMDISSKFILEISQFEKRFLEEKYHKNNNMLLLWFLNECAFSDAGKKTNTSRIRVVCTVMALDACIRKTWPKERMDQVMDNVRAFEDQFLPYIKEPISDEITPPIVEDDN